MWLVLLDHSGSMGGRFRNAAPPPAQRLVRVVEAETRLEAAKQAFLEQLARLPAGMPVAVFGFTSTARHLLTAPAGEPERFRAVLADVTPGDGTDIAHALNAAADHIESLANPPALRRALLVSDGESAIEPAVAAAERCRDIGITVDALLIDPGEAGESLMSRVTAVVAGSWTPVASQTQLRAGAAESAEAARVDEEAVGAALEQLAAQDAPLAERRRTAERVMFSAGWPARIVPRAPHELRVVVHAESEREHIRARLEARLREAGQMPKVTDADATCSIPPGTLLRVEPTVENLVFEPAAVELLWRGSAADAVFRYYHPEGVEADRMLRGTVQVKLRCGLPIAQLDLQLTVLKPVESGEAGEVPLPEAAISDARPIERVFASYAHVDEQIVRACREVYSGLNITLWMARYDIPQSAAWRGAIETAIGRADIFQLFWSTPAANSVEVSKELELGKLVGQNRQYPFIRAVYWENRIPPLPAELGELQMRRLLLGFLDLTEGADPEAPSAGIQPKGVALDIAEQVTVLPLVPEGGSRSTSALVRSFMGRVAAFLEDMTGLRYVPAPTLLVDRMTVRSVREMETVDAPEAADAPADSTHQAPNWLLPMLRSLLMAFHNGKIEDEPDWAARPAFYELATPEARGDFEHARREAEAGLRSLLRARLDGQDPMRLAGGWKEELAQTEPSPQSVFLSTYPVQRWLARVASLATPEELAQLRALPGLSLEMDGTRTRAIISDKSWPAMRTALLEPSMRALMSRYDTAFFAHFEGERTGLARAPDLAAYVTSFLDLVGAYGRFAALKRPAATIGLTFSGEDALLEAARAALGLARMRVTRVQGGSNPYTLFELPIEDYAPSIEVLRDRVLALIAAAPLSERRLRRLIEVVVPAYGIYASAHSTGARDQLKALAARQGLPEDLAMPDSNRVLVCTGAIAELTIQLAEAGAADDEAVAERRAAGLLCGVLVHEHFHAVLAGGMDGQGRSAAAARHPERWAQGSALNESIAAWAELHFARDDPWLTEQVRRYIEAGDYPVWPYRGAERVEAVFQAGGIGAIRELVRAFRTDPALAQAIFDREQAAPALGTS